MSLAEAKSKGCFAIINKQFFDFVCSKQDDIADYTSQKMAKADAPDVLQQRLNAVKDRVSKNLSR
jgi:hypothetical protein